MNISYSVKKMQRPHVRVMLDFMGMPWADHPTKVPELRKMLVSLGLADPDKFALYHDLIVYKRLPEGDNSALLDLGDEKRKILSAMGNHLEYLEGEYVKKVHADVDKRVKSAKAEIKLEAQKEIEAAKKQFITHRVRVGNKPAKEIGGVVPAQWKKLCELVQSRMNILMVGPSGCGKTHVAGMLAEAMDLPDYAAQSCSAGISESIFTGWLLPTGNNGKFEYVQSEFVRIYENGGLFLLDEFDNSDANLGVFLNMAIAQDHFFLPQRFGNTKVKKHKDFVCIAAANTFGHGANAMYAGRTKLDGATLDRFKLGTVGMTYDHDVERHLVKNDALLNWGWSLREILDKHNLQKILSTRVLQDAYTMMRDHDWSLETIQETFFADWSREELAIVKSDLELMQIVQEVA